MMPVSIFLTAILLSIFAGALLFVSARIMTGRSLLERAQYALEATCARDAQRITAVETKIDGMYTEHYQALRGLFDEQAAKVATLRAETNAQAESLQSLSNKIAARASRENREERRREKEEETAAAAAEAEYSPAGNVTPFPAPQFQPAPAPQGWRHAIGG